MSRNSWLSLGFNTWSLAFEASSVVGLRTLKIAAGGAPAAAEARRMISEKIEAGLALQASMLTGGFATASGPRAAAKALAHYRRRVRANRRRLTKGA